jgi:hypothetical protein
VDHRIVGFIAFVLVLVNPLSATSLFSPARAALFGLVVLQAAGSESRQAQNLPQGACYKAMHHAPLLVSPDLSAMASPTRSWILQTWRVE